MCAKHKHSGGHSCLYATHRHSGGHLRKSLHLHLIMWRCSEFGNLLHLHLLMKSSMTFISDRRVWQPTELRSRTKSLDYLSQGLTCIYATTSECGQRRRSHEHAMHPTRPPFSRRGGRIVSAQPIPPWLSRRTKENKESPTAVMLQPTPGAVFPLATARSDRDFSRLPRATNKHVFVVRPEAAFGGCLHACSSVTWFPLVTPWFPFGFPWKRYLVQKCFSFGPRLILGGAYMLVSRHACSSLGVRTEANEGF